ncbi:hypothetical protein [Candidatus Odyssella thessalonicensis]|uniref:hypothetical protein n=1 Tax=Candidatus Odyssella thessalonicensis TaxID=84647 RepID=UPI000225A9CC|nr:hypothetical protein [Candidatus Odyssella thessalonicensis]
MTIKTVAFLLAAVDFQDNCMSMEQFDSTGIAKVLHTHIDKFAHGEGTPLATQNGLVKQLRMTTKLGIYKFYGIAKDNQAYLDFLALKGEIAQQMGVKDQKLVQIVGDSNQFSEEGTIIAREFLTPHLEGNHILEYGFTGYLTDDRARLDTNSLLNEYIEDNPHQAYRVLANVVGHSIYALEQWGCKASPQVKSYVVVYNENGMGERFTKFGDDVTVSDYIQSPADGDMLLLLEGGAQSFKQAVNVLKKNVPIKALLNIREPERRLFFSAAEFFYLVKQELLRKSNLSQKEVRAILKNYLRTHAAWDNRKPDADTKEELFSATVEEFIKDDIYKKLLTKVEVINAYEHLTATSKEFSKSHSAEPNT